MKNFVNEEVRRASLPSIFQPQVTGDLVRVGRRADGGYVVSKADVLTADALLSCGINDDWSFEKEFLQINPVPAICYDGTVSVPTLIKRALKNLGHLPDLQPVMQSVYAAATYKNFFRDTSLAAHKKINVGVGVNGASKSFSRALDEIKQDNIFLKIDIEGDEYYCLDAIEDHQERFVGIAIEFHQVPLFLDRITRFVESLRDLKICSVHANNFGAVTDDGIPFLLELTFTGSDILRLKDAEKNEPDLSLPCDSKSPEIEIYFDKG